MPLTAIVYQIYLNSWSKITELVVGLDLENFQVYLYFLSAFFDFVPIFVVLPARCFISITFLEDVSEFFKNFPVCKISS